MKATTIVCDADPKQCNIKLKKEDEDELHREKGRKSQTQVTLLVYIRHISAHVFIFYHQFRRTFSNLWLCYQQILLYPCLSYSSLMERWCFPNCELRYLCMSVKIVLSFRRVFEKKLLVITFGPEKEGVAKVRRKSRRFLKCDSLNFVSMINQSGCYGRDMYHAFLHGNFYSFWSENNNELLETPINWQ
jgi:hypothetical protein